MIILITLLFTLESISTSPHLPTKNACVRELTDGCSAPALFKSNKYVRIFEPACLRHDVCYQCGQFHEWKRGACDTAFLRDMKMICHLRHSRKRYSWWQKFKILLSLGYDVVKWWTIPGDSLKHCLHGANIFYKAVDGFGQSHYGLKKKSNKHCKEACALTMGSPKNKLEKL